MKRIITMKRVSIVGVTSVALLIGAVLGTSFNGNASGVEGFSPYVDAMGHISLPKDFRTRFVHLGSWAVVDDRSSKGLHNVYTERKTVEQYRKTGKFPDGATLVKEIRKLESGELVTGHPVVWGSSPVRWFVMVKDAKGRFDGNPLWAKGWGWALFNADDPKTNVAKSYEADCKNCHIAAEKSDRVFIQGYPILGSE
ncbi:MAG: cytochrome P460 family protein [Desulfomonilaceae bacterium]